MLFVGEREYDVIVVPRCLKFSVFMKHLLPTSCCVIPCVLVTWIHDYARLEIFTGIMIYALIFCVMTSGNDVVGYKHRFRRTMLPPSSGW